MKKIFLNSEEKSTILEMHKSMGYKTMINEKLRISKKVLDQLVFRKFNIPYDIKMEYSRHHEMWYMVFWVDVDVDRLTNFTSQYDPKYENFMENLNDEIKKSLHYVNLQGMFGGVLYDYYNDDETEEKMNELTQRLYQELENRYNVRPHEAAQNNIYFYYYKPSSDELYTRIEFLGDDIVVKDEETGEEMELVSCSQISDLMYDLVEGYIAYDIVDLVCT